MKMNKCTYCQKTWRTECVDPVLVPQHLQQPSVQRRLEVWDIECIISAQQQQYDIRIDITSLAHINITLAVLILFFAQAVIRILTILQSQANCDGKRKTNCATRKIWEKWLHFIYCFTAFYNRGFHSTKLSKQIQSMQINRKSWTYCLQCTPKSSILLSGMDWYSEGPSSGGL